MIEPYDNMMKRFDLKFKRPYRFVANPQRELMQIASNAVMLFKQIELNIVERERKGIDQAETKALLKTLLETSDENL